MKRYVILMTLLFIIATFFSSGCAKNSVKDEFQYDIYQIPTGALVECNVVSHDPCGVSLSDCSHREIYTCLAWAQKVLN